MKRRHWFVIFAEGIAFAFMALLPIIGIFILTAIFPEIAGYIFPYAAFITFYFFAWLILIWMLFFIAWTNYYLDILLVTNKRIIDIEQIGLFSRDVAELRLENIQDIKVEAVGIIQSFLKMGNLHIQTAGQNKEVSFKNIPNAYEVKNVISTQYDHVMKEHSAFRPPV